jgi:hypothetical protein
MHMRGDPSSMQSKQNTQYNDVCSDVGRELQDAADAAVKSGIEPWRLILDPGECLSLLCASIGTPCHRCVWLHLAAHMIEDQAMEMYSMF